MLNKKKLSILAGVIIIIGIAGSFLTYRIIDPEPISKEKTIDSAQVAKININADNSHIHIYPSKDPNIKVALEGESTPNIKWTFTANVKDSTLFIDYKDQQRSWFNFDIINVLKPLSINVYLPGKQYETLKISSNNGYVSAEQLSASDLSITAHNGKVELEGIHSQVVNTTVHNGHTSMKMVSANAIKAKAYNGNITLDDAQGRLEGETHNGSISLNTQELDRNIDFKTHNGKISIKTEREPANVRFNASAHNGKVNILNKYDRNAVIGDGKNSVTLATQNGGISVKSN